jgi:membrane-bound lytic murein transglycosylase B
MPRPLILSALLLSLLPATALATDFDACLGELQQQARAAGLSDWIVEELIPGLEQQSRVLELDRQQPEFVKTFAQYLNARVTKNRVEKGRELYTHHREFLRELTSEYGVPGHYLVAFWGLETNYGNYLGNMPTLDSLATLACDERRKQFFTGELLTALELVQRDNLDPAAMRGSWAGAMGHTQFMPSTYARAAVDGDGDGRIDLWGSPRDALASGARYLQSLGWQRELRWGREISLPENFDFQLAGLDSSRALREWADLGIRRGDDYPLPRIDIKGSLLVPAGHEGPAFMVYENFRVIMGWNRSEFYALSVGYLADRIAGGGLLYRPPPEDQPTLSREEMSTLQRSLSAAGYDPGPVDGILGPGTRRSLSRFQQDQGLVPDGFPGPATLEALRVGAED